MLTAIIIPRMYFAKHILLHLDFFAWVSCCWNARVFGDSSRLAWSQGWPESRNVAPIFGYTELDLCIEWSWPLVFERFSIRFAWVWLDIDNGQFLAWPGAAPYLRSQSSGVSQLSSLLYRLLPTQLQLKDLCFTPLHVTAAPPQRSRIRASKRDTKVLEWKDTKMPK